MVINEYNSGYYDEIMPNGKTEGENIMEQLGFVFQGEAYDYVWVWWTVLFCIGLCIMSVATSVWCLNHVRHATGGGLGGIEDSSDEKSTADQDGDESLETKGATLTFKNVNYIVTASTSKDKLHLLKGVNGYFEKGKMTALMGSSGAGYVRVDSNIDIFLRRPALT